jgi:hypothetical protein
VRSLAYVDRVARSADRVAALPRIEIEHPA